MIQNEMTDDLQALNEAFGMGGVFIFEPGNGGLSRVRVAAEEATAEVYLQGAHVTQWQPTGTAHPGLFLSERSQFSAGKAIRGGVPLIFPWFADRQPWLAPDGDSPAAPPHGFVRAEPWLVESTEKLPQGAAITFVRESDAVSRGFGFDHFVLRYRVVVGTTLQLSFEVRNTGNRPLLMEEALHAYFPVGDIRQVTVTGLGGTEYLDRADGAKRKLQQTDGIDFTGETDRLYLHTRAAVTIHDAAWQRRIVINKQGSSSTVVWNPWEAKATTLADLGADAWPGMVCVEPGNARDDRVQVAPGAVHMMTVQVRIEPLHP